MTLHTILSRESGDVEVVVTATVMPYAQAVGAPEEVAYRFAGRIDVEIESVTAEDGTPVETTDDEDDQIRSEAADVYRRF